MRALDLDFDGLLGEAGRRGHGNDPVGRVARRAEGRLDAAVLVRLRIGLGDVTRVRADVDLCTGDDASAGILHDGRDICAVDAVRPQGRRAREQADAGDVDADLEIQGRRLAETCRDQLVLSDGSPDIAEYGFAGRVGNAFGEVEIITGQGLQRHRLSGDRSTTAVRQADRVLRDGADEDLGRPVDDKLRVNDADRDRFAHALRTCRHSDRARRVVAPGTKLCLRASELVRSNGAGTEHAAVRDECDSRVRNDDVVAVLHNRRDSRGGIAGGGQLRAARRQCDPADGTGAPAAIVVGRDEDRVVTAATAATGDREGNGRRTEAQPAREEFRSLHVRYHPNHSVRSPHQ
jgi:hypothetical protein